MFQQHPFIKRWQTICNCNLWVQGSICKLCPTILPTHNTLILISSEPTFPHFLSLVECTNVGLPHLVGKLLQGEFSVLQTAWGFAFTATHVRHIIAHIIRILYIVDNVYQQQCQQQVGVLCQLSKSGLQNCFVWVQDISTQLNHCRQMSRTCTHPTQPAGQVRFSRPIISNRQLCDLGISVNDYIRIFNN